MYKTLALSWGLRFKSARDSKETDFLNFQCFCFIDICVNKIYILRSYYRFSKTNVHVCKITVIKSFLVLFFAYSIALFLFYHTRQIYCLLLLFRLFYSLSHEIFLLSLIRLLIVQIFHRIILY